MAKCSNTLPVEHPNFSLVVAFIVSSSANAAPEFEGRGGEELANDISCVLASAFEEGSGLDLESLCVAEGQHCWILYIDVLVSECG